VTPHAARAAGAEIRLVDAVQMDDFIVNVDDDQPDVVAARALAAVGWV
jgi:hypothetical protein